ncbi:transglycosylase domain-containing protein [Bacillus infantis]|uniref:transglycosylase domain-containing protein n=1 Tax=Bacillus infantis TaxID=324767 RepID=UPI003CF21972
MKTLTGYLTIAFILPFFVLFVYKTADEASRLESLPHFLDSRIEVTNAATFPQTSLMTDQDGNVISEIFTPYNRIPLAAEDIPEFLKKLVVASEDERFYKHKGFDLTAIGRALAANADNGTIEEGGSTITQQLARNLYLTHEQTYNRKLTELLYAYQMERTYSKEEILSYYLNSIYFQNGAYGIEAASKVYFQTEAANLSYVQLAFLAAIPNNPSMYNPAKHFDRTKKRQELLIDVLAEKGEISPEDAKALKGEKIAFTLADRIDLYPDYTTYAEAELRELIRFKEGIPPDSEEELDRRVEQVLQTGVVIHTSLDPDLQQKAVHAASAHLPDQKAEAAAAVVKSSTHGLAALTGGRGYRKYDFNRGYQAFRQPGSAIKPLLVYAPYIERTRPLINQKVDAGSLCISGYCPHNYSGKNYGKVSLEQAFIHSYNTPAVRLLSMIGIEEGFKDLDKFGFSKVGKPDRSLAAAIGGFSRGVSPLELAGAYTVFANGGIYQPARAIQKVTDKNGSLLYAWEDQPVRVWSNETIDKMRLLLQETVAAGTGRKAYFPGGYTGGKTGTTNDYKDYWFAGLTDEYTAAVWVGKDQPESMESYEKMAPHLLIWKDILK